jgi:hypothetical protein
MNLNPEDRDDTLAKDCDCDEERRRDSISDVEITVGWFIWSVIAFGGVIVWLVWR